MEPEDEDHPWPSIRELALRKGKHDPNLSMSDRLLELVDLALFFLNIG